MKYKYFAKIACRIMAIYFFIISLNYYPGFIVSLINFYEQRGAGYNYVISLVTILPLLSASILLWTFADNISKKIVKGIEAEVEAEPTDNKNIAELAFAIMGMFVLVNSIPAFITSLVSYKLVTAQGIAQSSAYANYLGRVIGDGIKVLLGMWLLLGFKSIVNALRALRELGKNTIEIPKE